VIKFDITNMFFDSKKVVSATDRATRRVLSRFGAFVRRTAKQSIRKRKKVSQPGSPPSSKYSTAYGGGAVWGCHYVGATHVVKTTCWPWQRRITLAHGGRL